MAAAVSNMQSMRYPPSGGAGSSMGNVTLTIQPSTSAQGGVQPMRRSGQPHMMRFQHNNPFQMGPSEMMGDGPGRRLRKNVANVRRHVDYVSTVLNHAENRLWQYGRRQRVIQQPDELYQNTALPVHCTPDVPVDCILTKFVRAAMNKLKCPVYSVCWSPEGKRLITGASTGEFTLWNGTAFNFETILQAHDVAIRAMRWSSNEQWLISADQNGYVKYWQPNMNNVHMFAAHKEEAVRGIAFSPTDVKFATASDDGTARIWDFARCSEEKTLRGHGSEVRCIDWHPNKGLVVTGSRDTQQPVKLWDPKSGSCLATFQDHKSSVMAVEFNKNGNWLLTGGRDHLVKMYDIRVMKEVHTYRAHKKEVISVAWHPVHEGLFVSGGGDGSICYWLVENEKEIGLLEHAHDQAIWAMRWHPMGHILATGSNDNNTKFWARNRPGDTQEDIFGQSMFANMVGALDKEREPKAVRVGEDSVLYETSTFIPGMGLDDEMYEHMNRDVSLGGVDAVLVPDDVTRVSSGPVIGAKRTLIKQPPAKKAQRQFERMWNISKGVGAGTDDFSAMLGGQGRDDESAGTTGTRNAEMPPPKDMPARRPKGGLLGAAPTTPSLLGAPKSTPSLLGPPPGRNLPPKGPAPPQSQRNSEDGSWQQKAPPQRNGVGSGAGSRQGSDYNSYGQLPSPTGSSQPPAKPPARPPLRPTPSATPNTAKPPPVVLPGGLQCNEMGVPIIPAGLPPHLWPMPPTLPQVNQPPPAVQQRPPAPKQADDHDYRIPPPSSAAPTGDIDLRSMPPNFAKMPPVIHQKPPPPQQFQQQQQQRMPPPPTQASQRSDENWRSAPPPTTQQPLQQDYEFEDPRLADPRLRPRQEPRQEQQQQPVSWMPQFNTPTPTSLPPPTLPPPPSIDGSLGVPPPQTGANNGGGPVRNGANWRGRGGARRGGGPYDRQ